MQNKIVNINSLSDRDRQNNYIEEFEVNGSPGDAQDSPDMIDMGNNQALKANISRMRKQIHDFKGSSPNQRN